MEQATETHVCPICADTIVDEGEDGCVQDALFCEGDCQCWLHRWCAGVTRERYAVLSSDEEPFLCLSCTVAGQQAAITAQQADIACLRECVNALTSEVRALKATVAVMQSEPPLNSASTSPTGQAKEWSVVVSKGNGNGRKGREKRQRGCPSACSEPPSQNNTQASSEETAATATTTTSAKSRSENKVKVTGARRIWGTRRSSNVKSIKSVIARICKIGELRVIRKDRVKPSTQKSTWWYVLHAKESTLSDLETKWDPVNMQTGWKLEPCFMVDSSPSPSSENSNGDPLPLATPPALPDPIVPNSIVPNSIVPNPIVLNPIVLNPIVPIVPTPANESTVIVDSDVAMPVNLPNNSPTYSTTSGSSTTAPNYATVNKSRPLSGDQ